jgi:hypothetical protein
VRRIAERLVPAYIRAAGNQTPKQIGKLPKSCLLMLPIGIYNDGGVQHLAGVQTLEEPSLDSAAATDACVAHLAGLRNLRKLHPGRARIIPSPVAKRRSPLSPVFGGEG